jgi:hypothetical protein
VLIAARETVGAGPVTKWLQAPGVPLSSGTRTR